MRRPPPSLLDAADRVQTPGDNQGTLRGYTRRRRSISARHSNKKRPQKSIDELDQGGQRTHHVRPQPPAPALDDDRLRPANGRVARHRLRWPPSRSPSSPRGLRSRSSQRHGRRLPSAARPHGPQPRPSRSLIGELRAREGAERRTAHVLPVRPRRSLYVPGGILPRAPDGQGSDLPTHRSVGRGSGRVWTTLHCSSGRRAVTPTRLHLLLGRKPRAHPGSSVWTSRIRASDWPKTPQQPTATKNLRAYPILRPPPPLLLNPLSPPSLQRSPWLGTIGLAELLLSRGACVRPRR